MKYPQGKHPNSLANLSPGKGGRPKKYDAPKKTREVSVTEEGWLGSQAVAKSLNCSGVSELLERIGRGDLVVLVEGEEANG